MTALVLWLYGLMAISSVIMIAAWAKAAVELAVEHGRPWLDLRWCKAFFVAAGLTLHAAAMAVACGYRSWDMMANGRLELGSSAAIQVAVLCALSLSKSMFVWAGSTGDEHSRRIDWLWWGYLYALIVWGLWCWTWAAR